MKFAIANKIRAWPLLLVLLASVMLSLTPHKALAAITYFASSSNPADNSSRDLTVGVVAPPGSMVAGDLVIMIANARESGQSMAISATGGQIWTSETAITTNGSLRVFWARYNGTWSASPSVLFPSSANATTVVMHVFRPTYSVNIWAIDVAQITGTFAAPGSPFDVTIPGVTTTTDGALVLAVWESVDNNTWGLQTAGWANAGTAQYRNSDGSDSSQSSAYRIMTPAGASGSVTNRQTARGGDGGNWSILAFREVFPIATLATGSDPVAATIAPGAAATDINQFTLQTSAGTETISSVTVNLSTASGIGTLAITDNSNTVRGSITSPVTGSNTISVTGMSATTTLSTFKVRVTPLAHTAMPAVPGAAYAITAPVTAWVGVGGTHTHAGSDTNTNAVTIDNLSPVSATAVSGTAGNAQTTLNWTTSASTDFSRSVMLRWTGGTAGGEVPAEGTDYVVGATLGTATVVCVRTTDAASTAVGGVDGTGTGGCSAAALTNGQAYTYKIFQKDANGNYDVGVAVGTFTPTVAVASFNAFELPTGVANCAALPVTTVSGPIKTNISGSTYSLCIVALNSTPQIQTTFNSAVKVEVVGNYNTGVALDANNCPTTLTVLDTIASTTLSNGRASVAFNAVPNAWRDVRVRISYPTSAPTLTKCSLDNYAIRPNSLAFTVTDGDWETAGTTRTLDNSATPGGRVHKAGRPFTITATAYNGAGAPAITTNYAGTPTASIASHIIPTACLNGTACTLTSGTFSDGTANDGIVSATDNSYAEVGAFNMQLTDTSFASVDAGDSSTAERYITSGTVAVGRFVPDHFTFVSGSRRPVCDLLSYMDQPFALATTLEARNLADVKTENYHPAMGGYAPATVTWQAENANNGTNLGSTSRPANASAAWTNGSYEVNSTTATFNRLGTPDGPYDSLQLGVQLADPDGPVLVGLDMNAATSGACAPCTAKAVGAPISVRFGRLRLLNFYGSELLRPRVEYRAEYWDGSRWATNLADTCTVLAQGNIARPTGLSVPVVGAMNAGIGFITFAPVAAGSYDIAVNLGASINDTSCNAPPPPGSTPANQPWLKGHWSAPANCGGVAAWSQDPSARIRLGSPKAPYIYLRERY